MYILEELKKEHVFADLTRLMVNLIYEPILFKIHPTLGIWIFLGPYQVNRFTFRTNISNQN
jgi:hypothetical protein